MPRHLSDWTRAVVAREVGQDHRPKLLEALESLDEAVFGSRHPDRMAAAMVILVLDGHPLDAVVDAARSDWRDLLMASGLAHADWPDVLARRFGTSPPPQQRG